jgi:tetratricopeptide (TPR) repeat protein
MAVGQNRFRRGDADGARRSLELALAAANELTGRAPRNARFQQLLAWTCLSLADIAGSRGELDQAGRLSQRARESARLVASIEPASATWQAILGRAETNIGQLAMGRKDWVTAALHLTSARRAYDELVARDPSDSEVRRAAAVAIAQLAEVEAGRGDTDGARSSWVAALAHFAWLSSSGAARARLEWANGLRLYAAFERSTGDGAAADQAIHVAMSIVDGTSATIEKPSETAYRAGVLLEAGRAHAAHRRSRDARSAWERAATILRARASAAPLEAESAALLRAIEAELSSRVPPRRGGERS